MRVVAWMLLTVNQCNSIHRIVLHVSIFVASHDQLLLSTLQPDRSNILRPLLRDIDISQILLVILFMPGLLPLLLNLRQIMLRVLNRIVQIDVLSFVDRWLLFWLGSLTIGVFWIVTLRINKIIL